MATEGNMMTLYERILALHPKLTPRDFTGVIRLQDDGAGAYIKSWDHPSIARPSDADIAAAVAPNQPATLPDLTVEEIAKAIFNPDDRAKLAARMAELRIS